MHTYSVLPKKKPLLCLILEREGALTDRQIEQALLAWQLRRDIGKLSAFGEIVLSLGFMRHNQLAPYIALQRKLAAPPTGRSNLGRLLLENGLVRPQVLLDALREAEITRRPLGETLIAAGALRKNQLELLLRLQGRSFAQAS